MLVGLLCLAAACAAPSAETAQPAFTLPEQQTALPTLTSEPEPTVVTPDPQPTLTPQNQLDASTTFEVLAALHAHILEIEGWLPQGLSSFERQAVIQPLAELSIRPLGAIFQEYSPQPGLAASWQQAADLYQDFYPRLDDWVDGDLDDVAFTDMMAGFSGRSAALIAEAGQVAAGLDVEISQYGDQYALAKGVVFQLSAGDISQAAGGQEESRALGDLQENPALVVREMNPFVYPFAGMDVFLTIGLLENTGAQAQERVEVEIRFFNFLGEHLGTLTGRLLAQVALPGSVYPFSASVLTEGEEEALQDWTEYEVTVLSQPVSSGTVPYQDFSLDVSSARRDSSEAVFIEGGITNQGAETVAIEDVRIAVIALDTAGKLVGVGSGSVSGEGSLSPGQSVPIQAFIEALSGEPVTYRLFAEVIE